MKCTPTALIILSLYSLICEGDSDPSECYLCQSSTDSNVCGAGFLNSPSIQSCRSSQPYCLKLVEIAGRRPMVYRKCSYNDCTQERAIREGTVVECSVCTTWLCNGAHSISPFLFSLAFFICLSQGILSTYLTEAVSLTMLVLFMMFLNV